MSEYTSSVLRAALGICVFVGGCWLLSENRKRVDWRLVISAIALQFVFGFLVLKVSFVAKVFDAASNLFVKVQEFSYAGSHFLFGSLVEPDNHHGFIWAFQILPTIIFFAALSSVLYYLRVLQVIVYVFAWVMSKTMKLSGAESLSTAANIFLGQTEAPLLIKPFLEKASRSEMYCIMVGGMGTIAGSVLAAVVGMAGEADKAVFARNLLCASIMAAPATILISKLLVPETKDVDRNLNLSRDRPGANVIDAAIVGANDGLMLALNIAAALIAFTAMVAMANWLFGLVGEWTKLNEVIASSTGGTFKELSMQYVFSLMFAPFAWLIGVPGNDVMKVGQLLGERTVLNEFFAYKTLTVMKADGTMTNPRSIQLSIYALCGFANLVSMGIQVGGIGALAPHQRPTLASLAFKAMCGGVLTCLITACVASFFI